ncbi:MAG: hypothetical protein HY744_13880 [Deltaproteobacteria bacterium]|nr:hypothetical protein [Deltaproteobacteria bacterium]
MAWKRVGGRARSLLLLAAGVVLVGCGEPGPEPATGARAPGAGEVDMERVGELINQAQKARKKGKFDEARALLADAERAARDAAPREQLRVENELVDKAEAKSAAKAIGELGASGKCREAIDRTVRVANAAEGELVGTFLRQFTAEANLACLVTAMADPARVGEVRALAAEKATLKALGKQSYDQLTEKLVAAVVGALFKTLQPAIDERRWADVTAAMEKAIASGDAGEAERLKVTTLVREGVAADIRTAVADNVGKDPKGAEAALARIDRLIEQGGYRGPASKPAAPGAQDKREPLPSELTELRAQAALWVVCAAQRCKSTPVGKMWAYGNLPLSPAADPEAAASQTIKSGTPVWQLATAGKRVLVALSDPGQLEGFGARAKPAAGWVTAKDLRGEDTSEWLPPGDSIVGTWVWGPLREGQAVWEIGTVVAVDGRNVKIRRMSDRQETSLPRHKIQFGVAKAGLKVLAGCAGSFAAKPAVIEELRVPKYEQQGDPVAKVACQDDEGKPTGEAREEQLGALRMKPAWLPPRR